MSHGYISDSENSCDLSVEVKGEFAAGVVGASVKAAVGAVALD